MKKRETSKQNIDITNIESSAFEPISTEDGAPLLVLKILLKILQII